LASTLKNRGAGLAILARRFSFQEPQSLGSMEVIGFSRLSWEIAIMDLIDHDKGPASRRASSC
jgi:hypothetical protein